MAKRVIVSIDGGGIRGIIPLIILKEIQQRLNLDFFTLNTSWWGTSTGALISGAVIIQSGRRFDESIQNILDIYEFRSATAIHPHGVSLPTRALSQLIRTNFDDYDLTAFPNLNIAVSKDETFETVIFNARNSCKVADAIMASCAYPGLFPPVEINGVSYVDGYINAKNPTELAVNTELKENPELIVLSLGTGILRLNDQVEENVKEIHNRMQLRSENGEIDYYRFDPVLSHAVDSMQNTSPKNIINLRKDAMHCVAKNEELIEKFIRRIESD